MALTGFKSGKIMKKTLFTLFLIVKLAVLNAQHPAITSAFDPKIGGNGNISSTCVATDDLGNMYLAGYFSSTINLNNGIILTVGTVGNLFVAKYDKFGSALWAKNFGSNNSLQQIKGIKVKPDGSEIYITGYITGVAVFGATTLTPTLFGVSTTLYSDDIFVAKLLDNGGTQTFAWAVSGGGRGNDKSYELDYDNFGKIYIAGRLSSGGNSAVIGITNVTFGSLPVINCVNSNDSFVARLTDNSTSATWDWVKTSSVNIACSNLITYDDEAFGVATNKTNGDVFIVGYYYQSGSSSPPIISFGSTNMPLGNANEGYVAKLNTNGDWQWASKIGGVSSTGASYNGEEEAKAISVDSVGNAYIIGTFTNNVAFGNGGGSTSQIPVLTSYGSDDVFIAKINDAGTWQWAKGMGGAERETAGNIAYKNGQIWATGTFRATATFKTANQLTMAGSGSGSSREDVYLVNIDKNANWVGDGATKGGGGSFDGSFDAASERIGLAIDNQNVPVATGNHIVSATSPPNPVYGPTTFTTSGNFVFRANSNEIPPLCTVSMSATQPAVVNVSINSNANLRIKALLKDGSGGSVIAGKLTGNVTITHLNGSQVTYLPSNGSAFITHLNSNNQAYWFEQMGGPDAIINDIAFSDEGIFVVGDFTGTGSFRYINSRYGDEGFYISTPISKGLSDIFVGELVSYPIGGSNEILFAWLDVAGGSGIDHGASLATHDGLFTAITGFVSASSTGIIYGLNNVPLASPPSGSSQLFVAALYDHFVEGDNQFETFWVYFKSHTQTSSPVTAAISRAYDVIVNASNEAIICGNYSFNDALNASQAPAFGGTLMPFTNGQNLLVAKISNTGTWLWVTKAGNNTTAGHFHNAVSLVWGEDSNFYLTGGIQHTGSSGVDVIKFGLTSTSEIQQMTTTQLNDILVAKLNTNGTWIWAKRGGGVNSDYGLGINFKNQKVFITGYFISTINLGGTNLVSAGSTDIYFAQLSKLGDWLPYKAQSGGGMSGDGYYDNNALPFSVSLDVDANDNAYSAGFYSNSATFGTFNLSNTFNGNDTAILLKAFCSTCTTSPIVLSSPSNNIPSFNPEQKTASNITATNHVLSGNVLYQAGSFIELNPGFKVDSGTVFKAQLGGCN